MLVLYHAGLTVCSKKPRLTLKEKGVPYTSRFMNLAKFEHHDPDYLKLNPNALVPTLVHDGNVIIESTVINEYIDEVFPDVPLRPADPVGRARVRLWAKAADEAMMPNMMFTFSGDHGIAKVARQMSAAERDALLNRIPIAERRDVVARVTSGGYSATELQAARAKAAYLMNRVERALEKAPYLAGDQYSLADINMLPYVDRFKERVIPDQMTPALMPRTCDWLQRMMERPAVQETFQTTD